ncbi:MAG TPA: hypothetical protein VJ385_06295 [Fibrobacteria bacterium]|nr:hypothetical protein [Fibrobacteria bacterium]
MMKRLPALGLFAIFCPLCAAQSLDPARALKEAESDQPSAFASFNERIVKYYSAAVKGNMFSSKDGSFELNASVYGLRTVFDPGLSVDTLFLRHPRQRNANLGMQLGMGDGAKVDRIGGKVKWAFINGRDRDGYRFGEGINAALDGLNQTLFSADSAYIAYLKANLIDASGAYKVHYDQYETSQGKFAISQDPRDLDPVFYRKYGRGIEAHARSIRASIDSIAEVLDKRLLATAEVSGDYRMGEGSHWAFSLEAYRGVGRRGEIKAAAGYRVTDSASTWSRFRWGLPVELGYTLMLCKTSESTIDLTALAGTEFRGMAGEGITEGTWADTYGLGLSLPIKKGFSLPILIRNDSFSAWHGTASVELSLNLQPK